MSEGTYFGVFYKHHSILERTESQEGEEEAEKQGMNANHGQIVLPCYSPAPVTKTWRPTKSLICFPGTLQTCFQCWKTVDQCLFLYLQTLFSEFDFMNYYYM